MDRLSASDRSRSWPLAVLAIATLGLLLGGRFGAADFGVAGGAQPVMARAGSPTIDLFRGDGSDLVPLDPATLADGAGRAPIALGADGAVSALFSADGSTLVSVSGDGPPWTATVRDAADNAERRTIALPGDGDLAAVSRDGARLVWLNWDRGWDTFDTRDGRLLATTALVHTVGTSAAIAPDARRLYRLVPTVDVASSLDELAAAPPRLEVYDLTTGSRVGGLPLPGVVAGVWRSGAEEADTNTLIGPALAVSPDGRRLVIVHADRDALTLVDAGSLTVEGTRSLTRSVGIVDRLLALVAQDAAAKELAGTMLSAVFGPDGNTLYVFGTVSRVESEFGGQPGAWAQIERGLGLRVVDVGTGRIVADGLPGELVDQLIATPDGRAIFVAGPQGGEFVRAWTGFDPPRPSYVVRRLDATTLETRAERDFGRFVRLVARGGGDHGL